MFSQNPLESAVAAKKQEIRQQEARLKQLHQELEELRLQWIQYELRAPGLPVLRDSGYTVCHAAMVLNYNEKHEQANWVAHILVPEVATGVQSRTNNFRPDPKVPTGTATKEDYWRSGFDRGHLAPSADFRWSFKALDESFYYSNMAPQRKELNRERWSELEDHLRQYVIKTGRPLYVVTGGILKEGLPTIGPNQVSVPEYFYKVALDYTHPEKPGIAFIMPNSVCRKSIMGYSFPIDSVEARTGIDFFPKFSAEEERKAEGRVLDSLWNSERLKQFKDPLTSPKLPRGAMNTLDARQSLNQHATVCGTVAGKPHMARNGNIYINLDKPYPDSDFTLVIFKKDIPSFSYDPLGVFQDDRSVCATGKVTEYQGRLEIILSHPRQVKFLEETEDP
ncbi:MAG: DNA/RNA non-specific endonuclease [Flavobacteriales bacterium]|nr:DNA/RNA non-specific endonuclease [Flavobacteriales bacterium]MDW8432754.1 DNA/RNA non-specific endonuclease [Flavobacteriales bacterium]